MTSFSSYRRRTGSWKGNSQPLYNASWPAMPPGHRRHLSCCEPYHFSVAPRRSFFLALAPDEESQSVSYDRSISCGSSVSQPSSSASHSPKSCSVSSLEKEKRLVSLGGESSEFVLSMVVSDTSSGMSDNESAASCSLSNASSSKLNFSQAARAVSYKYLQRRPFVSVRDTTSRIPCPVNNSWGCRSMHGVAKKAPSYAFFVKVPSMNLLMFLGLDTYIAKSVPSWKKAVMYRTVIRC
ncbi:hypothetical protein K491DRAFT_330855 [Lophiostoma macrostomum CBS 122681]|uniref:Uncharacterized protein n=1 Tax=Lophiostoma macrostomum CBS 122681 TaxID=1314788 RepID=A0A6A6TDE2_9PLEO|nr:hypothetical protein K491DRAFT_330855 [Lophiostoma macrostomum CBS 122681]